MIMQPDMEKRFFSFQIEVTKGGDWAGKWVITLISQCYNLLP